MNLRLRVKLLSLVVHVQEYLETEEPFDFEVFKSLAYDAEIVKELADFEGLLPVKRND